MGIISVRNSLSLHSLFGSITGSPDGVTEDHQTSALTLICTAQHKSGFMKLDEF